MLTKSVWGFETGQYRERRYEKSEKTILQRRKIFDRSISYQWYIELIVIFFISNSYF